MQILIGLKKFFGLLIGAGIAGALIHKFWTDLWNLIL